ncbi:MAG: metallophosphoesterase [Lachnospiraceae bacterium]|nr:metallophosphoesterase [Lachnospiraceae bacterium]
MLQFLSVCLFVIVIVGVLLLWVSLYDTHHFVISKHSFTSTKIKKQTRYVMLSDLHGWQYGKDNQTLLAAIRQLNPDGILIAGDMITALKGIKIEKVELFLTNLATEYPVYYANGNHEQKIKLYTERYGDLADRYQAALDRAQITPMVNKKTEVSERGISIYGLEIDHGYYKRMADITMEKEYLDGILGTPQSELFTILLAHNPDYFETYAQWGADLVLSGHVHGGIARLPFLGGVIAPSLKLFPKYDGGVFREKNSTMILGRGIGTHSPNVRFFNPGEVVVVDLLPEGEQYKR